MGVSCSEEFVQAELPINTRIALFLIAVLTTLSCVAGTQAQITSSAELSSPGVRLTLPGYETKRKVRCGSQLTGTVSITNTTGGELRVDFLLVNTEAAENWSISNGLVVMIPDGTTKEVPFSIQLSDSQVEADQDVKVDLGGWVGSQKVSGHVTAGIHVECPHRGFLGVPKKWLYLGAATGIIVLVVGWKPLMAKLGVKPHGPKKT